MARWLLARWLMALLVAFGVAQTKIEDFIPAKTASYHFSHHEFVRHFLSYAKASGLQEDLDAAELYRYARRFASKGMALFTKLKEKDDMGSWGPLVEKMLHLEAPVMTSKFLKAIQASAKWKAQAYRWFDELTLDNVKDVLGWEPDLAPGDPNQTVGSIPDDLVAERRLQNLPAAFNSKVKWPACADTLDHIRNQGLCGSCWAQAAALSMDGRLCIMSEENNGAKFHSWTSAGYFTSCYHIPGTDGCAGGEPTYALTQALRNKVGGGGMPTGGLSTMDYCVPYWGTGDAMQHFDAHNQAPRCPTQCTNSHYSVKLGHDLYYPGSPVLDTYKLKVAMSDVYQHGPLPMCFQCYRDLMSYKSGYYQHTGGPAAGGHCVTMLGYEAHEGVDYVLAANSWGPDWGEQGRFKMDTECCQPKFTLFGIDRNQPALGLGSFRAQEQGTPREVTGVFGASAATNATDVGGVQSAFYVRLDGVDCQAFEQPAAIRSLENGIAGKVAAYIGIPDDYVMSDKGEYGVVSVAVCGKHGRMLELVKKLPSCEVGFRANDSVVVYGVLDLPSWIDGQGVLNMTLEAKFKDTVAEEVVRFVGESADVQGVTVLHCNAPKGTKWRHDDTIFGISKVLFFVGIGILALLLVLAAIAAKTGVLNRPKPSSKRTKRALKSTDLDSPRQATAVSPLPSRTALAYPPTYQPVVYTTSVPVVSAVPTTVRPVHSVVAPQAFVSGH